MCKYFAPDWAVSTIVNASYKHLAPLEQEPVRLVSHFCRHQKNIVMRTQHENKTRNCTPVVLAVAVNR